MANTAIFPGSFDPVTTGHMEIIMRAAPLFDKLIIAIGVNSRKKTLFSLEKRIEWLESLFRNSQHIEVAQYKGLTLEFCKERNAQYLVRGLRSAADFEYERTIAQLNQELDERIETVFLASAPAYSHISSTIVREILINRGDASKFLPDTIAEAVKVEVEEKFGTE